MGVRDWVKKVEKEYVVGAVIRLKEGRKGGKWWKVELSPFFSQGQAVLK